MKKSKRIQALVDLNLMQEKKALEVIAEVQKRLLTSQTQVEQLKHYRLEYAEKFKRMGSAGTGIRQLLDFRAFMEKLDSAIHGQELALTRIENELHHKRKVWEGLHHRTTSLEKVYDQWRKFAGSEQRISVRKVREILIGRLLL